MAALLKACAVVLAVGVVLASVAVGAATAAIYRAGSVGVEVHQEAGTDLSLRVPAALIDVALAFAPREVERQALGPAAREVEPFLGALHELRDELARLPDFVLVEVVSPGEHLRIEKREGRMLVLVENDGNRVHLTVPLRTVDRLVRRLESWAAA